MPENLNIVLEFGSSLTTVVQSINRSGGAELLFGNIKKHKIELEQNSSAKWTIKKLLIWIKDNLLKERKELFIQGDSVRPGILVLVNESDWELVGELDYELVDNDNIMFISTLHGG